MRSSASSIRLATLLPHLALLPLAMSAHAADLTVSVRDASGKPVSFAVVTYTPDAGAAISASDRAGPFVMSQKNIHFHPFVLAVPVGATVNFPNLDRVNHHVYSFSPIQPFQFPLYGHGKSQKETFLKAGTETLGCNIHDSMIAYIRVVATPYYATTSDSGQVVLRNLPAGAGKLSVWQPLMDAPGHEVVKAFNVSGDASTEFSLKVQPMPDMDMGG